MVFDGMQRRKGRVQWTGTASKATGSRSKARAKEQWGKLTDDDLDVISGRRNQLEGKRSVTAKQRTRPARKSTTDITLRSGDGIA